MRAWLAIVVLFVTHAIGCGSNPPPSAPPPSPAPASEKPVDSSPSPAQPETPSDSSSIKDEAPTEKPPSRPPASPTLNAELREKLAALIVPGANGRWQIADAVAIELEKSPALRDNLLLAAQSDSAAVRRGAWHLLAGQFDGNQEESRTLLRGALADDDAIVRALAFRIVNELPEQQQASLVAPLGKLLSSEELTPENRAAIARILGRLKEDAIEAEESLAFVARNDKQARVRAACLVALWQIASPEANLPRFRAGLQDADASVRVVAAARLREMGPDAAVAAESLARSLEDQDQRVSEAAAEALIRIGEPAVKHLTRELSAESAPARRWAVFALAKLGPVARPALAELEKVSNNDSEEEETRKMAALAVKRLAGE